MFRGPRWRQSTRPEITQQRVERCGRRVRVSLAAKNTASRETEFFENIGGVKSYTVDVFRLAG